MMEDKLRSVFLDELKTMIEQEYSLSEEKIKVSYELIKSELIKELASLVTDIYNNYQCLYEKKKVGTLEWIYLSFLRSSMLDFYPAYRLDFYDERGCLSEVECCGDFKFDIVFLEFYAIQEKVESKFKQQNRVKAYEGDEFLAELYERFHHLACEWIPELLQVCIWDVQKPLLPNTVKVRFGELFDKTIDIYRPKSEK